MEQRAELPFFFADRRTPVMLEPIFLPLLLILAAMILGFCLILPGIRGRERIFAALRFFMLGSAGFWIFFRLVLKFSPANCSTIALNGFYTCFCEAKKGFKIDADHRAFSTNQIEASGGVCFSEAELEASI